MVQLGFYDVSVRYEGLDAKDPLLLLAELIPWEDFRAPLWAALRKAGVRTSPAERKSRAGRKPWDEVMIFKALVLQALYTRSDDQAEYQIRDRLSFSRFLGLGLQARVPDATTLWLYREALAQTGLVEQLFDRFDGYLRAHGYQAKGGQILDATIVQAPKQHNTKAENAAIEAGDVPADWQDDPAKLRQKDRDARWTKKNGRSLFGYKNHIGADVAHKLIRRYSVTSAAPHDSQERDNLLDPTNSEALRNLGAACGSVCLMRDTGRERKAPLPAERRQNGATDLQNRAPNPAAYAHQAPKSRNNPEKAPFFEVPKSLFASFSSKKEDSSFFEKTEAKKLLFLRGSTSQCAA